MPPARHTDKCVTRMLLGFAGNWATRLGLGGTKVLPPVCRGAQNDASEIP